MMSDVFWLIRIKEGKPRFMALGVNIWGKIGIFPCSCPCRLSAGTVQSLIGQLNSIFQAFGKGSTWHEETKRGNPASSREVQRYLKATKLEQSKAHVLQKQAKPLFLEKLKVLCNYFDRHLNSWFVCAR